MVNIHEATLKIARNLIKIDPSLTDWVISKFPELKEPEDERIRKLLVEAVTQVLQDQYCSNRGVSKEKVIAWLEKQGESKPIGKLQLSEELYEHIRNTCACIDDALSSETLADIKDYLSMAEYSANSAFDMIEKQGKQKPTWSEEDERNLNDAILFIETGIYSLDKDNLINWLKSLRPQNQWKPSKEQLKSLKGVIDVGYFTSYPNSLETLYEQLKQL